MNSVLYPIWALVVGLFLGTLFFGGLWFTVKKTVTSKMPALLVLGSFIIRVGITLAGFYFIGLGNWKILVICLIGFIIARFVVIFYTKSIDENKLPLKKEDAHEA